MHQIALLAGSLAAGIFMVSQLPMLIKAGRTKDLASYSPLNIVLANVGNLIYAVYVFSLPAGPIWAIHTFYLVATGLMLFWWLRYSRRGRRSIPPDAASISDEVDLDRELELELAQSTISQSTMPLVTVAPTSADSLVTVPER